jgi:indolepyruvate ferredoxin oxidoreductase, beta subunit
LQKAKGENMNSLNDLKNMNIILAGVGGQGSITAGQIAARAASIAGQEVVMSEVHGMAQRGGSVMSTVRYGRVQSPVVSMGEADFLLGFEKLEALRYAPWLKQDGVALVSDQCIIPTVEALKKVGYPTDIERKLSRHSEKIVLLPALGMAKNLGNPRLIGTVILGAFAAFLDLSASIWEQALGEIVPPKTISLNLHAFEAGYEFVRDSKFFTERTVVNVSNGQRDSWGFTA